MIKTNPSREVSPGIRNLYQSISSMIGKKKYSKDNNEEKTGFIARLKAKNPSKQEIDTTNCLNKGFLEEKKEPIPIKNEENQNLRESAEEFNKRVSLEKLKNFDFSTLVITKKGEFHKRRVVNDRYLFLCKQAGVDPYELYRKGSAKKESVITQNYINKIEDIKLVTSHYFKRANSVGMVNDINSEQRDPPIGFTNMKINGNEGFNHLMGSSVDTYGRVDLRSNERKEEIALKIEQAKRELANFDTSKLVRRKDGGLDRRYNINKAYIQLEAQCHERYYM